MNKLVEPMKKDAKIVVLGASGFLGSSLMNSLALQGYNNLLRASSNDVELEHFSDILEFFDSVEPEYVFMAAGVSGGIKGIREKPVDFLEVNIGMVSNVLNAAYCQLVKKVCLVGSSCGYPVDEVQPFVESSFGKGRLEESIDTAALSKVVAARLMKGYNDQYDTDFIMGIPATLYGPGDKFGNDDAHFVPMVMEKIHIAKQDCLDEVMLWGTGNPRREMVFVDDASRGLIHLMNNYSGSMPVNLGGSFDYSIREIAESMKSVIGYTGNIGFDKVNPDGAMSKLMDSSKARSLGWSPGKNLVDGLNEMYTDFIDRGLA